MQEPTEETEIGIGNQNAAKVTRKGPRSDNIERLIVVAIIAILAAIAVPNFLEAQTRAKVSPSKSDLRTYDTANNAYLVDWNKFPIVEVPNALRFKETAAADNTVFNAFLNLYPLSTPTAYLTSSRLIDPFKSSKSKNATGSVLFPVPQGQVAVPNTNPDLNYQDTYLMANYKKTGAPGTRPWTAGDLTNNVEVWNVNAMVMWSMGPSYVRATVPGNFRQWYQFQTNGTPLPVSFLSSYYDPTNGTVSQGAIFRWFGETYGMPEQS